MSYGGWKSGNISDAPNPWSWNNSFPHGGSNNRYTWSSNSGNVTSTNCGNTVSENCGNTTTYNNSGNKVVRTGNISSNGGDACKGGETGDGTVIDRSSTTTSDSVAGGAGGSISIGG
ncbi:hypothetical protein N7537_003769 [Penicillium hordei]|uniref:Uncharacterized protein n=1 Tax=Penicillium hordei TaxID=40994 RepID=A0AAD6EB42_9EURO|nr:uncharacterized protein N7537_003769 [Penicillium hordei]KAJ5607150.1 hypothetical protein N7537_003769 [Penicillium hordei]